MNFSILSFRLNMLLGFLRTKYEYLRTRFCQDWKLIRRAIFYTFVDPLLLVIVSVITIGTAVLTTYNPELQEQLIYALEQENKANALIQALVEKFFIDLILKGLASLHSLSRESFSQRIEKKIQEEFYASMLDKDMSYYDNRTVGDLTSKLNEDVSGLARLADLDIIRLLFALSTIISSLTFMISISPKLVFIFILFSLPGIAVTWSTQHSIKDASQTIAKLKGDATSIAIEAISNIKTVKSFSTEEREFRKYTKKLDERNKKRTFQTKRYVGFNMAISSVKILIFTVVAFLGIYEVINGKITAFQLSRFIAFSQKLSIHISTFQGAFLSFFKSLGNAERIFRELDTKPLIDLKEGKIKLEKGLTEKIKFRDVSFSYPNKKEVQVLNKINLEIDKGQHIAIVGESGGGKTTLINLLQRLYDPTKGNISIGNIDLKEFNLKWLHSKMGVISQDSTLFSGTIEENVVYGVEMYSDEDLDKAITQAYMKNFIEDKLQFPDGLGTQVGERGGRLSGGQKQRVAIARALIKNPDIFVFDEPTSALDTKSEHEILKGLDNLLKNKNKTVIVIAHRLTTIMHCDKIIVCQKGEIVETGSPKELLEKNGVFKNLVDQQLFSDGKTQKFV